MKKLFNKYSVILIIGIPIILLLYSYMAATDDDEDLVINKKIEYNRYYDYLPAEYEELILKNHNNDSTFFSSIFETYGRRELFIFKPFPLDQEVRADIEIKLFLPDNTKPLELIIENEGVLYNYNNKPYAVFRHAIPFISIDSIKLKRITLNKWQKKWSTTITKPFKAIKISTENSSRKTFNSIPNPLKSIFVEELEANDILYLPYSYTVINDSLFETKDDYKNYLIKDNLTIVKIEEPNLFLEQINRKKAVQGLIDIKGNQTSNVSKLFENYASGLIDLESVFNLEKCAKFFALKDLYVAKCDEYLYFVYNSDSNLLEPFFVHAKCLGQISDYLITPKFDDLNFIKTYIETLNELYQKDIYEDLIINNKSFENEMAFINSFYPKMIFDFDVIKINQRILQYNLTIKSVIKPAILSVDSKKMVVSVLNLSNYPVLINGLKYNTKTISNLEPRPLILSGQTDTIEISLPRSFENLFVSKKTKNTGFVLHKHIYDLNISYSTLGLFETELSPIIPYQEKENVEDDLFRNPKYINNHEDIVIRNNSISFKKDTITISSPLVIPKGYNFKLKPGTHIDIIEGGKIISHSPLKFSGTKENPIIFGSSDKKGQGILVLSKGEKSDLNFIEFNNLTNPVHGNWSITGAVTFYESPVTLNNVSIKNNRCEDALNVVRAHFTMINSSISGTQSDAFDGDFVTGTISNCYFDNLGNDAIDVSGSDLIVDNVIITNAGDKGLSAGEDSKMTIKNVEVSNSEIAVAGKDLSIVKVYNLKINNTKLGFTAFQKKPEFGPSNIKVDSVQMNNVETKYLIENTSSLIVDGQKIESTDNVKDRMYGVEFGVSSAETRNSQ